MRRIRFWDSPQQGSPQQGSSRQKWLIAILLLSAAAIVVLLSWRFVTFGEFVFGDIPHVSAKSIGAWYDDIFYVWHSKGGGTLFPQPLGKLAYLPAFAVSLLNPALFKILWYVLPLLLGMPAFFLLLRRLKIDTAAAVAASVFYVVNPVTIAWFNLGQPTIVIPLFPLGAYCLVRWGEKGELSWLLCATMALASILMFYPSIILPATALFGIVALANLPPVSKSSVVASAAICAVVLALVLSSYYFEASIGTSSTAANYSADFKWNYKKMGAMSTPLLVGNQGSSQETFGLNKPSLHLLPAMLLLAFVVFSIFYLRQRNHLVSVAIFIFIAVLLYLAAAHLDLLTKLAQNVSVMATLRNPIKLQLILMFSFSIALAYAMVAIPKGKPIGSILIIIYLALFMSFAFDGLLGLSARTANVGSFQANPTLLQVNDWLSENTDWAQSAIILPYTHQVELYIGETHHNAYPVKFDGSDRRVVEFYRNIERNREDDRYFANALDKLAVDYVIVQNATEKQFPLFLGKATPQELTTLFRESPYFSEIRTEEDFVVFERKSRPQRVVAGIDVGTYNSSEQFEGLLRESPEKILIPQGVLEYAAIRNDGDQRVSISAHRISPTRYSVEYDSNTPFLLVLREAFHKGWTINPGNISVSHFEADRYANGWLIDATGKGSLDIEFAPQRSYKKVLALSLSMIAVAVGGIALLRRRER